MRPAAADAASAREHAVRCHRIEAALAAVELAHAHFQVVHVDRFAQVLLMALLDVGQ